MVPRSEASRIEDCANERKNFESVAADTKDLENPSSRIPPTVTRDSCLRAMPQSSMKCGWPAILAVEGNK